MMTRGKEELAAWLFNKDRLESVDSNTTPQYAVSIVLKNFSSKPEILFIERAKFEGDHWSGDIAFPGGKKECHDMDLIETSIRETKEELDIVLDRKTHFMGEHKVISLRKRGVPVPGILSSHLFIVDEVDMSLSEEVASAFFLPVSYLLDEKNMGHKVIHRQGKKIFVPGIVYEEHIIWGLTYLLLVDFLSFFDPSRKFPVY